MESTVCILLSTYNGEKYLREFLDSALNQTNVKAHLIVRADGSINGTMDILNSYAKDPKYSKNITIIRATNIGCEKSFYEL